MNKIICRIRFSITISLCLALLLTLVPVNQQRVFAINADLIDISPVTNLRVTQNDINDVVVSWDKPVLSSNGQILNPDWYLIYYLITITDISDSSNPVLTYEQTDYMRRSLDRSILIGDATDYLPGHTYHFDITPYVEDASEAKRAQSKTSRIDYTVYSFDSQFKQHLSQASSGIQLTWEKPSNAVVSYEIYRDMVTCRSPKLESEIGMVKQIATITNPNATSFLDEGVADGSLYNYTIEAKTSNGGLIYAENNWKNKGHLNDVDSNFYMYLAPVGGVKLESSNDTLTLSWNTTSIGDSYVVYDESGTELTTTHAHTYVIPDVKPEAGHTYTYYVSVITSYDYSKAVFINQKRTYTSVKAKATLSLPKESKPAPNTPSDKPGNGENNPGNGGGSNYPKPESGENNKPGNGGNNGGSNNQNEGGNNNSGSSGNVAQKLSTPALSSVKNSDKGVSIKWKKVAHASSYNLLRKTGKGKYETIAKNLSAKTLAYTDKTVTEGKTYSYVLEAKNASSSLKSKAAYVIYLKAGKLTQAKSKKSGQISLKWKKNSKAEGYQIKYVLDKKNTYCIVKGKNTLSKTFKLKKNKKYTLYIRSYKTLNGKKCYSAWSKELKCKTKK